MNSHFYALNNSITLSKRRNQQIVQQSQMMKPLLKRTLEEVEAANLPLMIYGVSQVSCGEVTIEFILSLTSLFSISLFVFPLLVVL
jgi:hypothetical protein